MNYNLYQSLEQTSGMMWGQTANFLPMLAVALLVIIVGWWIAGLVKGLIMNLFTRLKLDDALGAAGFDAVVARAGYRFRAGYVVGVLAKWFILAVTFVVALDILRLQEVTFFLRSVVLEYLPNVMVAVLILFGALVVAKAASEAVGAAVRASGVHNPVFFQKIAYYAIIVFAVLAAANQLRIAEELVQTLFMGLVFALALALGLAFGLGGREAAARMIDNVTKEKN